MWITSLTNFCKDEEDMMIRREEKWSHIGSLHTRYFCAQYCDKKKMLMVSMTNQGKLLKTYIDLYFVNSLSLPLDIHCSKLSFYHNAFYSNIVC